MRPESVRLVIEAARINPHATIQDVVGQIHDKFSDAIVDVYAQVKTGGATAFDVKSWDTLLDTADEDTQTLAQFVDTPEVRALIRAQEAGHANA